MPHQARSRVTVEALVAATARILLEEGYDACTTNRVARVAGVSIGSLYQYFPDKEALVVAVVHRHLTRMREGLEARLAQLGDVDLGTAVTEMVRAMLDVHHIQPRLHRVLLEQLPRIGALGLLHELGSQFAPAVTAWLEAHREELSVESISVAVFVLIASVEGVLTRALLYRPGWVESGVLEQAVTRLVLAYLAPQVVPPPVRAANRAHGPAQGPPALERRGRPVRKRARREPPAR